MPKSTSPFRVSASSFIGLAIALPVALAIVFLFTSLYAAISETNEVAYRKQRDTIVSLLRQAGTTSARELKAQTIWTEAYTNVVSRNLPWMESFFGPYLHKLLDYERVYVLSDKDELVYAYSFGEAEDLAPFESHRAKFADLISIVRGSRREATRPFVTNVDLGDGEVVQHKAVSDIRLIAGRRLIVVVTTIVPDTKVENRPAHPPFLMVAMRPVDKQLLSNFSVADLRWGPATSSSEVSTIISGLDGSNVGFLSWRQLRPGNDFVGRMVGGFTVAAFLLLTVGYFFARRGTMHAKHLEDNSKTLETINEGLAENVAARAKELEITMACMAQGLVLLRPDASIVLHNPQAMALLQVESAQELSEALKQNILSEQTQPEELEQRTDAEIAIRRDLERPDGCALEIRSVRLPEGRQMITISDITLAKRKRVELESAIQEAKSANEAKTRFLSTMSHEMRTPLNGIIGTLELIGGTDLTEEQTRLVDVAVEASEALLVHINDVLDFSKMEAGKLALVHKPFKLEPTIRSTLDIIMTQAEAAGNTLTVAAGRDLPALVVGDRIRFRQILLNLVSNANKFTRNGQITVTVERCGGSDEVPCVEIAVQDTGIGIPSNRIADLFQEFSMLDQSYTRRSSGTGLGLAISKRLVEAMGGEIGLESEEGKGSRFWFRITFQTCRETDAPESSSVGSDQAERKLNILLVDDNATNRLVGGRLLESLGHTVTTANNGKEAVHAVGSQQSRFDVIFMDISMPQMDGVEATSLIRQLPEPQRSSRIIALTANAIAGDKERFLSAGMNGYLSKPLRKASIVSILKDHAPDAEHAHDVGTVDDSLLDLHHLRTLQEDISLEIVRDVVASYRTEIAGRINDLEAAAASGTLEDISRISHAIAGSSASVGAASVRNLAGELERLAQANDETARSRADAVHPLFQATVKALAAFLERSQET